MNPKSQVSRSERDGHSRRVAYLCAATARSLGLNEPWLYGLERAAGAHDSEGLEEGSAAATVLNEWMGLRDAALPPAVRRAAQILDLCDGFDDAVEFAAYERRSIGAAIAEFGSESGALRHLAMPNCALRMDGNLPVMPRAVSRLLRTSPETTSAAELESIVNSDPVLAARVVGAANSASFGSRSEIQQVSQAILRIGVPFARKVLISACLEPLFASAELRDLWEHSRTVAAAAHELAPECGVDQETAYLTGLVHDIGRLVMQRTAPAARAEEATLVRAGFPLVYAETLLYSRDHAAVGAELLKAWGIPDAIVHAVSHHHAPEATDSVLASVVYLAEELSGAQENLCAAFRRAVACEITGIDSDALTQDRRGTMGLAMAS